MHFEYHGKWSQRNDDVIKFALHLALKVMGEPSKVVIDAAGTHFENPNPTVGIRCAFKAMRDELIKEVQNEMKKEGKI